MTRSARGWPSLTEVSLFFLVCGCRTLETSSATDLNLSGLLPFGHEFLVVLLLATRRLLLDLCIFPLEPASFLFGGHGFLDKILHAVLFVDSGTVELCWTLDHRTGL